jgi:hypothetical protein
MIPIEVQEQLSVHPLPAAGPAALPPPSRLLARARTARLQLQLSPGSKSRLDQGRYGLRTLVCRCTWDLAYWAGTGAPLANFVLVPNSEPDRGS